MFNQPMNRRAWARLGSAAAMAHGYAFAESERPRRFRLRETAGLRRFGYPVQAIMSNVPRGSRCQLRQGGKLVPAQFRAIADAGGAETLSLEFSASMEPNGAREYEILMSDQTEPGAEPSRGLDVTSEDGTFRVSGSGLTYVVPGTLEGFLQRVTHERREYVRSGLTGFWAGSARQELPRHEPLRGRITRKGPLAVGLSFDGLWTIGGGPVPVRVDLTFPATKSWVELNFAIDDRAGRGVTELGLELDLAVEGSPTLVDLGATGTVYDTLRGEERTWLEGIPGDGWRIFKGDGRQSLLQATSTSARAAAEGWAHVMDASRCTAVAVADFGRRSRDRIEVAASGRVRLVRQLDPKTEALKKLKAWFHFVPMPVQVGAVTSPQSMLAPLKVEWL